MCSFLFVCLLLDLAKTCSGQQSGKLMVCVLGVYILLAAATLFLCGGFNRAASSPQVKDPYELKNVYNETAPAIRDALAKKLREYYPCQGKSCP